MKKLLFTFVAALAILPSTSFAQVQGDVNPNTASLSCVTISHNLSYRSRDTSTGGDVSTLQDFLQSKGYLNSEPTGYFGLITLQATKNFQLASGILNSGYVGPITRAKIATLTCGTPVTPPVTANPVQTPIATQVATPSPTNLNYKNLTITSISGPTTIQQGQTTTWTVNSNVNALGVPSGRFAYSVDWGNGQNITVQPSNVISHSYPNAGSYAVRFQVYDTLTGGLGSVTSIVYIKVTGANASPISVISPQAGQTYNVGDTLTVRWTGGMRLISLNDLNNRIFRTITQLPSTAVSDTSGSFNYVIPSDILSGFRTGTFGVKVYSSFGGPGDDVFDSSQPFTIQAQSTACTAGQTWNGTSCVTTPTISISQINPNTAAAGAQITISGTGFQQYDQACFANVSSGVISSCVTPNSFSANQMSLTVPSITAGIYTVRARRGDFLQSNGLSFILSSPTCPDGQVLNGSICSVVSNSQYDVKILTPNGGTFQAGSTLNIQWTATGLTQQNDSLGLAVYQTSLGSTRNILSTTVSNPVSNGQVLSSGSYKWTIPINAPSGTDYIVYLSNGNTYTQSSFFRIIPQNVFPTVNVTSPNGGEKMLVGRTYPIKWTATNFGKSIGYILLRSSSPENPRDYVINSDNRLVSYTDDSGSGSYNWTIPSDIPEGTQYKIVVGGTPSNSGNADSSDISDDYFSIYTP